MTRVYIASIETLCNGDIFRQKYNTLPVHRKNRVDRLKKGEDKRRSVGAWLLLEYALCANGISKADVALNRFGKPYLKNRNDVFFNLSHSGDFVMCAVSDGEVGCDVQVMKDIDFKMAERFFHPREVGMLASLHEDEKRNFFYRVWTLKESVIKALGMGMSMPMREFYFDFSQGVKAVGESLADKEFYFKEYEVADNYKCAVCCYSDGFSEIEYVSI